MSSETSTRYMPELIFRKGGNNSPSLCGQSYPLGGGLQAERSKRHKMCGKSARRVTLVSWFKPLCLREVAALSKSFANNCSVPWIDVYSLYLVMLNKYLPALAKAGLSRQ